MKNSTLKNTVNRMDALKIIQNYGLEKALLFYTLTAVGTLCFITSIILVTIPQIQNTEIKNNQILYSINQWESTLSRTDYDNLTYKIQLGTSSYQLNKIEVNNDRSSLSKSLGLIDQNNDGTINIPSIYNELELNHLSHHKHFSQPHANQCLILERQTEQGYTHVQGFTTCGQSNGIMIRSRKQEKLSVEKMVYFKMCSDEEECQHLCQISNGQFSNRQCKANYYVDDSCYIVGMDKSNKYFSFLNGCYQNMPERLSLVSNMHYKLIIREENDPILAALRYEGMDEISMILVGNDNFTFKPSDNLIYGKEIFLVGAGCFFMCLIFLQQYQLIIFFIRMSVQKEIPLKRQQKKQKREQQESGSSNINLSRQSIPLNY